MVDVETNFAGLGIIGSHVRQYCRKVAVVVTDGQIDTDLSKAAQADLDIKTGINIRSFVHAHGHGGGVGGQGSA